MVVARATTAKRSHSSSPSVATTSARPDPIRPTTASATSTTGIDSRVGDRRTARRRRRVPPKKPPSTPSVMPISPGRDHRHDADQQRDARAIDQPREIVAAELVGAEQVAGLGALHPERRLEAIAEILRERIVRHQRIAERSRPATTTRRWRCRSQKPALPMREVRASGWAPGWQSARSSGPQPRIEQRVEDVGQQREADVDRPPAPAPPPAPPGNRSWRCSPSRDSRRRAARTRSR